MWWPFGNNKSIEEDNNDSESSSEDEPQQQKENLLITTENISDWKNQLDQRNNLFTEEQLTAALFYWLIHNDLVRVMTLLQLNVKLPSLSRQWIQIFFLRLKL